MRPVRLVLDVSAVEAFPHLDVGETITQVEDNGGSFAVPWPVIAAVSGDRRWVGYLLGHRAHRPVETPWVRWPQLAAMADVLGSPVLAAVLWAATDWDCLILSGDAKVWSALGDDAPVVTF